MTGQRLPGGGNLPSSSCSPSHLLPSYYLVSSRLPFLHTLSSLLSCCHFSSSSSLFSSPHFSSDTHCDLHTHTSRKRVCVRFYPHVSVLVFKTGCCRQSSNSTQETTLCKSSAELCVINVTHILLVSCCTDMY